MAPPPLELTCCFLLAPLSPSCTCSFPASCQGVSLLYFSLALEYSFVGQDASPVRNFRNHVAGSWSLLFSTWENRKTACPRIPNKAQSTFRVPFCMQEQQLLLAPQSKVILEVGQSVPYGFAWLWLLSKAMEPRGRHGEGDCRHHRVVFS